MRPAQARNLGRQRQFFPESFKTARREGAMGTMCIRAAAAAALMSLSGGAVAQTADFLKQAGADAWRASKLPGVAVFGPDKKKVGTITDVLLDHTGKATAVVIGVGGFLGIGEKDVAVPFDQVTFTQETHNRPQAMAGAGVPSATALGMPAGTTGDPNSRGAPGAAPGVNGTPTGGAGGPSPAPASADPTAGMAAGGVVGTTAMGAPSMDAAGASIRSDAYPDHGTIALTADQLKAAPTFQFAK